MEYDPDLYPKEAPALEQDTIAAAPSLAVKKMGIKVLADSYTKPLAEVDPKKESEKTEKEAFLREELVAIAQEYYGPAASALRDDNYEKKKFRGLRSKTGRAQWEYTPQTESNNPNEVYTYRFAVHYDLKDPYEPTLLALGVRRALAKTDELFQLGIEFENSTAKAVVLRGRGLTKGEWDHGWEWPPMFVLHQLIRDEYLRRNPDDKHCFKFNTTAEHLLTSDQWDSVDMAFDFGKLPITLSKDGVNYLGGKKDAYHRRTAYNPATDTFEYRGQYGFGSGRVSSEEIKKALSLLLGVIPTHEL